MPFLVELLILRRESVAEIPAKPLCQDSNLDHRSMVCPQTDKVDRSFSAGTTEPEFPLVDFNRRPALSMQARRRADNLPICKGSVDFPLPGHALGRNWRQTESRVIPTSTRRAPAL